MNQYFKLYQDCFLVKGKTRSLLYDLTKNCVYNVPLDYIMLLEDLYNGILVEDKLLENEFILNLLENDIIFKTSIPNNFPPINTNYTDSHIVESLIINWNNVISGKISRDILIKLHDFICKSNIEYLFVIVDNQLDVLYKLLDILKDSPVRCIEVCISSILEYEAKTIISKFNRIKRVYVANCNFDIIEQIYSDSYIIYTSESINFDGVSPVITKNNLLPNRLNFIESQSSNLFYNKKLFFNENFILSLFPNSKDNFFFNDISNEEIISRIKLGYELWKVRKDNITICKDCEYRYMCNDPRHEYKVDPSGLFIFNYPCSFDPYI